jgi:murein tripeptide amidase MpaA
MIKMIKTPADSGNIIVHHIGGDEASLLIRADSAATWAQWFNFCVEATPGSTCILRIVNARNCTYPEAWEGYRGCVSDGGEWYRAETRYEDGVLTIYHRMRGSRAQFAYFEPYPYHRYVETMRAAEARWPVDILGHSIDGRAIERIRRGTGPFNLWLVGRQHSGEAMASWWMEGALERLADAHSLLDAATVHIVPLANPDGVACGNLRANAAGCDLNRQWHKPDAARAPEVTSILAAMEKSGVDFVLDVHGDEMVPHVFLDGSDRIANPTAPQLAGLKRFRSLLLRHSRSFQTRFGYPDDYAGDGAKGMCARAVAERFGAVGFTLEMPFKEARENPDPVRGWSSDASRQLGRECIDALSAFVTTAGAR